MEGLLWVFVVIGYGLIASAIEAYKYKNSRGRFISGVMRGYDHD